MAEWIYTNAPEAFSWMCSECKAGFDMVSWNPKFHPDADGEHWVLRKWAYCPMCGKKMDWTAKSQPFKRG